jgi:GrpB-like predicted nucleotidyltransferase (UPF0157 family)
MLGPGGGVVQEALEGDSAESSVGGTPYCLDARAGPADDGGMKPAPRFRADEPVRIEPYDPSWPERFEDERAALEKTLTSVITGGIHHVGSTAVPGLAAKPIIDILVGVSDLESSRAFIEPLAELGYLYAPYRRDEMIWFCKPDPAHRTHHLHLVPTGSPRYQAELSFRDYLRTHPEVAGEYALLKSDLANRLEHDRDAYTNAKTKFIRGVLRRAGHHGAA